jgi:hypothetical protein
LMLPDERILKRLAADFFDFTLGTVRLLLF